MNLILELMVGVGIGITSIILFANFGLPHLLSFFWSNHSDNEAIQDLLKINNKKDSK